MFFQPRSWLSRSSGGAGTGGSGSGTGAGGGSGNNKPAGNGRQIRTRARIMRSNTAIRGGSNSG
ncbi:hypothetical protein NQ314_003659 [Rhamnusium bicolor]|uniref:Uncharacterized protein n=1 Tax=Rhamnusium bicolor TaxID=1586634 RepID=A0AAV8ZP79_9CUCU|nr:hypothetical protein NQ314_003659 [Rhamnusium bicolor]